MLTCAQVMKINKEIGEISEMTVKFIILCVNILNHCDAVNSATFVLGRLATARLDV